MIENWPTIVIGVSLIVQWIALFMIARLLLDSNIVLRAQVTRIETTLSGFRRSDKPMSTGADSRRRPTSV